MVKLNKTQQNQIVHLVEKYATKVKELQKGSSRKNPVDSDIERSLKAMGFQEISDVVLKGDK